MTQETPLGGEMFGPMPMQGPHPAEAAAAISEAVAPREEDPISPVVIPPVTTAADALASVQTGKDIRTATPEELARMNEDMARTRGVQSALAIAQPEVAGYFGAMNAVDFAQYKPVPTVVNGRMRQFIPALNALLPEGPPTPLSPEGKLLADLESRFGRDSDVYKKAVAGLTAEDPVEPMSSEGKLLADLERRFGRDSDVYKTAVSQLTDKATVMTFVKGGHEVSVKARDHAKIDELIADGYTKRTPPQVEINQGEDKPSAGYDWVRNPDGTIATDERGVRQEVARPGGPADKVNEAMQRSISVVTEAVPALELFNQQIPGEDGTYFEKLASPSNVIGDVLDLNTGYLTSGPYEQANQAIESMAQSILRLETGAAAPPHETVNLKKRYVPRMGESEEVHERKLRTLTNRFKQALTNLPPAVKWNLQEEGLLPKGYLDGFRSGVKHEDEFMNAPIDQDEAGAAPADTGGGLQALTDDQLLDRYRAATIDDIDTIEEEMDRRGL